MCVFHYCFLCNANTGPDANCEVEYSAQILEQPSHTLASRTQFFWLPGHTIQQTPWGNLLNYI